MTDHAHPLQPLLRKLDYYGALSDADRAAVLALPHTLKTLEAHSYIVRQGDLATHACLIRSGFTYRHKIVADGGRQICSINMTGDFVDLHNTLLKTSDHNIQVLDRAELAYIPHEAIRGLAEDHPAVGRAMWFDTLLDGSIFREWMANIGRRPARRRLAHLLCEFAVRLEVAGIGKHEEYTLPMTQEQLADCTGLTAVHVNRTLRVMDKEGLLTRTNRSIAVNDWAKLRAVGDFETAYLHLGEDQLNALEGSSVAA